MTHTLSGLRVRTYTIVSDESWSRDCYVAISHPLSGLQVHTCTINCDNVEGEFRIATIAINSDDVKEDVCPSNYLDA